jgi:hypothetical protein
MTPRAVVVARIVALVAVLVALGVLAVSQERGLRFPVGLGSFWARSRVPYFSPVEPLLGFATTLIALVVSAFELVPSHPPTERRAFKLALGAGVVAFVGVWLGYLQLVYAGSLYVNGSFGDALRSTGDALSASTDIRGRHCPIVVFACLCATFSAPALPLAFTRLGRASIRVQFMLVLISCLVVSGIALAVFIEEDAIFDRGSPPPVLRAAHAVVDAWRTLALTIASMPFAIEGIDTVSYRFIRGAPR